MSWSGGKDGLGEIPRIGPTSIPNVQKARGESRTGNDVGLDIVKYGRRDKNRPAVGGRRKAYE